MKKDRRNLVIVVYLILGVVLTVLGILEIVGSLWSGMGGALIAVAVIRMIRILRYRNDEAYRENAQIEAKDERNRFIRNKAWAWAGYLFILLAAISVIVFKLMGETSVCIHKCFKFIASNIFHLYFDRTYTIFNIYKELLNCEEFIIDSIVGVYILILCKVSNSFIL